MAVDFSLGGSFDPVAQRQALRQLSNHRQPEPRVGRVPAPEPVLTPAPEEEEVTSPEQSSAQTPEQSQVDALLCSRRSERYVGPVMDEGPDF